MTIKIAVVGTRGVPANYGGIEKFCEELYSGLVKKGYEVTVYSRKSNSDYTEYRGMKIKSIDIPEFKGLDTFIHSFISTVHATFSDVDIIHFHAQGPAVFCWIPRLFAPKKLVAFTCHGIDWQRDKWGLPAKIIIKLGEIASSRFPHLKTAVSQYLIDYYKKNYGVKVEKTFTGINMPSLVPLKKAKTKYNLEKNGYFVFVGRLVPEKAIETLIQAFKTLDTEKKLVIVGDASNPDDYIKYLQNLNKDDERIIFTSYVDKETLSELYSNAIAYVSASKLEGLPATLLEAMSFAKPVLISDIGPHIETLEYDNSAGELFKVDDISACAGTLANILKTSRSELDKMGSSAQHIVSENFLWQKIIDQTDKIYKTYADKYLNYIDEDILPDKNKDQKLRIAIVNKFFYLKGGLETVMFEEAKLLEQLGHEVAFFSMHHPLNPNEYKYNKYFVDYMEFENAGNEYSFMQKIRIAKSFIYNKQAARKFEEFLDDFKPDIIHCHGITHQLTPSILKVAKQKGIPVVQTLHDYQLICPNYTLLRSGKYICSDLRCAKGNYYNAIINKCVKKSFGASILSAIEMDCNNNNGKYVDLVNKFVSPSKFLRNTVIKTGLQEEKITYIPNFINMDMYEPEYTNKGYFLYVGRLSFEKGLFTLLKTFRNIPDAILVVAGSGPQEKELLKYKEDYSIDNIEFVGYKSKSELEKYYKECIASIVPSEWYENAPMSIIEALAYGKPVIASKLGGNIEMIKDDYNGYLFSAGNIEDLQAKTRLFIENPDLSSTLGKNARLFALENYTAQIHRKNLLELYNSLLKTSYVEALEEVKL